MSDADEVWLTISSLAAPAEIRFNGSAIATVMPQENFEIAVSKLLKPFNELQILLELSGDLPNPLMGDVAVEIAS